MASPVSSVTGAAPQSAKRRRAWWSSAAAGALLLATPLVVFLRYHGYGWWQAESLACLAVLAVCGAVLGVLFETCGSWGRALLYALLVGLTVDIQSDDPDRWRLVWAACGVSLALMILVRHRLPRWGPIILGINLVISLVAPAGGGVQGVDTRADATPGDADLPIVVHLILDGHIGVEGVPPDIDRDGSEARRIRDTYLGHGFRVFGRAYSRHYRTFNSIPAMLNFDLPYEGRAYVRSDGPDWILEENRYFELMSEKGYAIRVLQSTYLDYCLEDGSNIESCWTFDSQRLSALQNTLLPTTHKMRAILGLYAQRSSLARTAWIPEMRITPIATLPVLEQLGRDIALAQPGTLFFAHLLLPHAPYGLMADCTVRPDPSSWLMSHDATLLPRRNSSASRFLRYPLYLAQLQCVGAHMDAFLNELSASPQADNMTIVIHGDHGARLDRGPPDMRFYKELEDRDYIDAYSTLFAIKSPGLAAGYDRSMLALENLLQITVREGRLPTAEDRAGEPTVMLEQSSRLRSRPMPIFGRELDEE